MVILMYRVIASDVDGVIKPYYDPVPPELAGILRRLSRKYFIVFLSGRQITYLDGLITGMGINPENMALIGEEGSVIMLPKDYTVTFSLQKSDMDEFLRFREKLMATLYNVFGHDIFMPPTFIILTISAGKRFSAVDKFVKEFIAKENTEKLVKLVYHRMHNVIQVIPFKTNKYIALKTLYEELGFDMSETIAIGDGKNDIPVLKEAGFPVAVGDDEEVAKYGRVRFRTGLEAFRYIEEQLGF